MNLDDALQTFIIESRELLEHMEEALLQLENTRPGPEAINAIFRAAHTIKGSAGLFGLDGIVNFTHTAESVLDKVRAGTLNFSPELVALLLAACDHLEALLTCVAENTAPSSELMQADATIAAQLSTYLGDLSAQPVVAAPLETKEAVSGLWHLSLRCGADVFRNGMDPVAILRYLGTLGELVQVVPLTGALPPLAAMDPESCYLGFECLLSTGAGQADIEGAFEFIQGDAQVTIIAPGSPRTAYLEVAAGVAESDRPAVIAMLAEHLPEAPAATDCATGSDRPGKNGQPASHDMIRVNAAKLDQHINLIGELIIASSAVSINALAQRSPVLIEAASVLARLVEEIRNSALQLRMVPIGATFNKFQRVVRDVAKELGKDIRLEISGADTELDKTVVERIGDPLTHLVRNAMDHGIEPADVRVAKGKPAQGTVKLNAYHDSGSIILEVSDDGGGLDRDRILNKAIDKGLVKPEQQLTDAEVYGLIFEAGLSTAEKVSNLSGRGVGMDVVHRNITALRGSVEIDSQPGKGTTMRIRMPLTLAIIDGFLVTVGASTFVIPLDAVVECVEFADAKVQDGLGHLNLRGDVLPLLRLANVFDCLPAKRDDVRPARENVVVVHYAGRRAGFVVDNLLGEFQTVIRPLGEVFSGLEGLSGFTMLGTGQVAPILDVQGLVHRVVRSDEQLKVGARNSVISSNQQ